MERKRRIAPGWTRIGETEFKLKTHEAIMRQPEIYGSIKDAISISAARNKIDVQVRDKYLGWLKQASWPGPMN